MHGAGPVAAGARTIRRPGNSVGLRRAGMAGWTVCWSTFTGGSTRSAASAGMAAGRARVAATPTAAKEAPVRACCIFPTGSREIRQLFPRDTVEIVEKHALERYGMTELVTDPEVLRKLEPNYELLKNVLTFKGMMKGEVLEVARLIIRRVVEELRRRLAIEIRRVLWGKLSRQHRSNLKIAKNLDVRRTIRDNLKHYDAKTRRIVLQRLHFFSRVQQHSPWHVIIAVDCSGSMVDSVIYSAVMAGIFRGLPSMKVSLVAFDTSVVDLTDEVDDPAELLMSVQLGGGTNIGGALGYCQTLVNHPNKTMLVLVTDFFEGGPPNQLLTAIHQLRESGVRVLGLAALDERATPAYDRDMAQRCVAAGAEVAALTPQRLAEWIGRILK